MKKDLFVFILSHLIPPMMYAQGDLPIFSGKEIAIVQTEYGKVRGYVHNGIYTFKGIPYAKADRFMAPERPKSWQGIRSSMTYGPVCPINPITVNNDEFEFPFNHNWGYSSENCLNLNIWTIKTGDGEKRPVMVWLHGGGFTGGSSIELPSYDGESLARTGGVVLVSVNHRLNVLGFLDLSDYGEKYKSSSNAGLMDLVAALKWIKENITNFGGDPENITIFGQSGGGAKVTCLMNAPTAKGLFHKGIVESGSYLTGFTEDSVAKRVGAAVLEELGLQPNQIDSLQKIPYERLNAAGNKALIKVQQSLKPEERPAFGLEWGPVHDNFFLPYQLNDAASAELSKNIPLMVGTTKNEFMPFIPGSRNISMDSARSRLKKQYRDKTEAYLAAVKKAYPETIKPSDFIDIDFVFRPGAIKQADEKALPGAAPVFMYLFTWQSPVMDSVFKAFHCMELPFVFNNIQRCEEMTGGGKEAYGLAQKVSSAWVNFAKTGNPSSKELPVWPAYKTENGFTMIFDNKCEVKSHPDQELLAIGTGK